MGSGGGGGGVGGGGRRAGEGVAHSVVVAVEGCNAVVVVEARSVEAVHIVMGLHIDHCGHNGRTGHIDHTDQLRNGAVGSCGEQSKQIPVGRGHIGNRCRGGCQPLGIGSARARGSMVRHHVAAIRLHE